MTDEIISYVENNKVVFVGSELVEIFSKYFRNIVQNLGIDGLTNISSDNDTATTGKGMEKYQYHPNIKVIQKNIDSNNNFPLDLVNPECITKITHQVSQQGNIPTKIIKVNKDLFHVLFPRALTML